MASSWPGNIDIFTTHVDYTEYMTAYDLNFVQEAITALETNIGYGSGSSNPLYSSQFGETFSTLSARLNYSEGVVGSVPALDTTAGDISTSQPGNTALAGSIGKGTDAGHRHAREPWGVTAQISTSTPGDTGAAGASGAVTDAGHVHPREPWGTSSQIALSTPGDAAVAGASGAVADASHVHPREVWGTAAQIAASTPGNSAAAGSTGDVTDAGHVHPREPWGTSSQISVSTPGDAGAAGSTGAVTDAGHVHPREAWGSVSQIAASNVADVAAAGSTGAVADAGHVHPREGWTTVTPGGVGQTATVGTSTAGDVHPDHVHQGVSSLSAGVGITVSGGDGNGHGALMVEGQPPSNIVYLGTVSLDSGPSVLFQGLSSYFGIEIRGTIKSYSSGSPDVIVITVNGDTNASDYAWTFPGSSPGVVGSGAPRCVGQVVGFTSFQFNLYGLNASYGYLPGSMVVGGSIPYVYGFVWSPENSGINPIVSELEFSMSSGSDLSFIGSAFAYTV